MTLGDLESSPQAALDIAAELGPPVYARSVYDVYRGLFAWVELQASIVPLVISILVVVAAFNIIGTLLMVVLEKTREIGTVLAMGASRASVRRLVPDPGRPRRGLWRVPGRGARARVRAGGEPVEVHPAPARGLLPRRGAHRAPGVRLRLDHRDGDLLCTLAAYLPARAAARIEPIRTIRFGG